MAIGGWTSSVVCKHVHLAAEEGKDVLRKMNQKIFGSK